MTVDLASIINSNNSNDANLRGAMDGVTSLFNQLTQAGNARATTLNAAAVDQALVTTAVDTATMDAQRRTLASATELGTNRDANSQALSGLISGINASFAEAQSQRAAIAEKQGRKILDDPLGWFEAQLTVNDNVAKYNNASANYSANVTQLSVINDLTQEIAQTDIAIKGGLSAGVVAANSRLAAAAWTDKSAQANMEAIKTNAEGLMQAANLGNARFSNQLRLRDQALQEANIANARVDAGLRRQALQLQLDDKKESSEAKAEYRGTINAFRKQAGMSELNDAALVNFMKLPEQKALLDDQYNQGYQVLRTGKRALATDVVTATQMVQAGGAQLDPGRQQIVTWGAGQVNGILEAAKAAGKPIKDINTLRTEAQKVAGELAKVNASNINTGNPGKNIYAPPGLSTLMGDAEIASLPGAQTILGPMVTAGIKETDMTKIVPLITGKIGTDISQKDAIGLISAMANKSVALNNATYSYQTTIGIPDQKDFKVVLPNPMKINLPDAVKGNIFTGPQLFTAQAGLNLIGKGTPGTKVYDLANPADVAAYVNASQASNLVKLFSR